MKQIHRIFKLLLWSVVLSFAVYFAAQYFLEPAWNRMWGKLIASAGDAEVKQVTLPGGYRFDIYPDGHGMQTIFGGYLYVFHGQGGSVAVASPNFFREYTALSCGILLLGTLGLIRGWRKQSCDAPAAAGCLILVFVLLFYSWIIHCPHFKRSYAPKAYPWIWAYLATGVALVIVLALIIIFIVKLLLRRRSRA